MRHTRTTPRLTEACPSRMMKLPGHAVGYTRDISAEIDMYHARITISKPPIPNEKPRTSHMRSLVFWLMGLVCLLGFAQAMVHSSPVDPQLPEVQKDKGGGLPKMMKKMGGPPPAASPNAQGANKRTKQNKPPP